MAEAVSVEALNQRLLARRAQLRLASIDGKPSASVSRLSVPSVRLAPRQVDQEPAIDQVHPLGALWRTVFREAAFWKRAVHLAGDLQSAGVFREHAGARLADFNDDVHRAVLTDRAALGVCIVGPVGVGKTRLAVALLRCALLSGRAARFALAGDLLSEIRETYREDAPRSERAVVDELCRVDCLVIDDLGREGGRGDRASDHAMTVLHRVLSKRLGTEQQTIVTSNLTLDDMESRYDMAIGSRLRAFEEVLLTGDDRRRL